MGFSHLQRKSGFVLLADQDQRAVKKYMTLVDKNGLIQVVPRPKRRSFSLVPLKLIALLVGLALTFKSLAVLNLGIGAYEDELSVLATGNLFERGAALAMWIDPITQFVVSNTAPFLK